MTQRWARRLTAGVALLLAAAVVAGCGGQRGSGTTDSGAEITCRVDKDTRISIATGNTTGVYYALGNALAQQVSTATGGKLKATAAETGASVQNIQQLVAGDYQVAFSLADTAADAVQGTGDAFQDKPVQVQALSRIYTNYTHVIVRNDARISSVADMRGKRISTGSPKSGTEVIARRLLKAAGLDPDKDVQAQRLDLDKTMAGMKSGTIDGLVWSGGLPTPAVTDLLTTAKDKVRFVDVAPLLGKMKEISPVYAEDSIPADTYQTGAEVKTIVVPNVLLVRPDLDANVACVVTKTLFERKAELEKANKSAKGITLDQARATDPVPLHRGATRALDDLGAKK